MPAIEYKELRPLPERTCRFDALVQCLECSSYTIARGWQRVDVRIKVARIGVQLREQEDVRSELLEKRRILHGVVVRIAQPGGVRIVGSVEADDDSEHLRSGFPVTMIRDGAEYRRDRD